MNKFVLFLGAVFLTVGVSAKTENKMAKIKLGWQVPWAIQGQLVQIFKHTDILKKNGIEAEFIGKTAGPELNELAMGGQVDVILTADQPASALFSKTDKWVGISRLMYNRTSTYAPVNSKINNLEDLKGKQVGVPFGTAAQRIVTEAVDKAKVTDVKFVNLGMLEQAPLIKTNKDSEKWGDFDALSGFDPIPAILESNKLVKMVHKGKVCAMIVMSKAAIEQNPHLPKNMVKALKEAYTYYNKNLQQVNDWFLEEAMLKDANADVLALAAEYEPNLKKGAKVSTKFSDEDFELIQKAADFVTKASTTKLQVKDFVTNKYQ